MSQKLRLTLLCATASLSFVLVMGLWRLANVRVLPDIEQLALTVGMATGGATFFASVVAIIMILHRSSRSPDPRGKEPHPKPSSAPLFVRGRNFYTMAKRKRGR